MASRRARREQAEETPVWDVWLLTALLSGVLLVVGGWLQAGLIGALAGALIGSMVGGLTLSHNDTAKAALVDAVLLRHRRHPHG